jgi:DNA-binding GntR family transcriptional regulator
MNRSTKKAAGIRVRAARTGVDKHSPLDRHTDTHDDVDPLLIGSSRRVFDEVYDRLRSAIVAGHFAPGERFVERTLERRLGVSRTPIREAIKRLEQEGLVVCPPHRGCFVRSPTFDDARQVYELRRVAEGLSGALAAKRATDSELAKIRTVVRLGRTALEKGDRESMLLRNDEFHQLQARAAGNVFLEQQLRLLWAYMDLLRGRSWIATDRAPDTQREHEAIVEALARRDAARARLLNETHVDHAWKVVEAMFRSRSSSVA